MFGSIENIVDGIFYCVLAGSVCAWIWLARTKISQQLPILEPQSRNLPFWTLKEFFVCFGMFIVCTAASQTISRRWMSPTVVEELSKETLDFSKLPADDMLILILMGSVSSLLAMLSVLVWMNLISRRQLNTFGLWPSWTDIKLGCQAAFLILPPVLLLSTLIVQFVAYEHQVLDVIGTQPTLQSLLMITITTVLFTPIFEEFTFRVLLQGGAEQVARRIKMTGGLEKLPEHLHVDPIPASEVVTWAWWPIVMASGTFAAMHIGQGAAPIPLFFLAFALGYLYRQTGRMWPCVVVHMVLNGFTLVIANLQVYLAPS